MPNLDLDWSPSGEAPPPAAPPTTAPAPVEQVPAKINATTGRPEITVTKRPQITPGTYFDKDWTPSAKEEHPASRDISKTEAATRGYVDLYTSGLAPAIAGLSAAGTAPGGTGMADAMAGVASENPGGEAIGEGMSRLWNDHFGNHPDPAARAAYNEGSKSVTDNNQMAWDQHAGMYMLGQLGAALSSPGSVAGSLIRKGMTGLAQKIILGTAAGASGNALYESGKALSEGRPEDIPEEAAKGAATGGVLGAAGRIGGEAVGGVVGKVASRVGGLVRSAINPNWEVGHQVVGALRGDIHAPVPDVGIGVAQVPAARVSTAPVITADFGGEKTAALAKRVAKSSPEGGQAIRDVVNPRHEEQGSRIGHFIRSLAGGKNYTQEADRIAAEKAAVNPVMYGKAYTAGDRPIWSDELAGFSGTDAGKEAIGEAARKGKDWAYRDGLSGFKPSITVTQDGQLVFNKGPTGVPTYPNIQFWDYVQRQLKNEIGAAQRAGRSEDVTRLSGVRDRMLADLDAQVPEFGDARRTAASFFGAENALDAGKNFVTSREKDLTESARNFMALKPEEKQIFQRSFASELATQIEAIPPNADLTAKSKVLDSVFLRDGLPRRKIEMVLGPQKTNELEAQLRLEEGTDRVRRVVQEPNWLKDMAKNAASHAGLASAVGGVEYLREGEFDPKVIVGIGLGFGIYRKAAGKLDAKVALKIGQVLASDDPAAFQKAAQMVGSSEPIMNALRSFTAAGTRVSAADVGFENLGTAGLLALQKVWGLRKREDEHHHHEPADNQQQDANQ
jgi:hypothetical protein